MTDSVATLNWRRRITAVAIAMMMAVGFSPAWLPTSASAEELVDLTLLFHGSVRGKIAPCG
jgi:hypothetical protein